MKKDKRIVYLLLVIILCLIGLCLFFLGKLHGERHVITRDTTIHNVAPAVAGTYSVTTASNFSVSQLAISNNQIRLYLTSGEWSGEWINNSFIFGTKSTAGSSDLAEFIKYLQQSNDGGATFLIKHIHILIGEDASGRGEMLYLCGVDGNRNHVYTPATDAGDANLYIFNSDINYSFNSNDKTTFNPQSLPPTYSNAVNALTSPNRPADKVVTISSLPQNILRADLAQRYISDYIGSVTDNINTSAFSFLISQNVLIQYITAAQAIPAQIVALQFYLGVSPVYDRLMLIMVGIDKDGNHIYINDGVNPYNYVLEEFMPCPVCPAIGNTPQDIANPTNNSFTLEPVTPK